MLKVLFALFALIVAAFPARAQFDSAEPAKLLALVVSSCGGQALTVGGYNQITVDTTGTLCDSAGAPGAVSSVTGTAGQITASPTTGNVVVSLPATITQNEVFTGGIVLTGGLNNDGLSSELINGTLVATGVAMRALSITETLEGGSSGVNAYGIFDSAKLDVSSQNIANYDGVMVQFTINAGYTGTIPGVNVFEAQNIVNNSSGTPLTVRQFLADDPNVGAGHLPLGNTTGVATWNQYTASGLTGAAGNGGTATLTGVYIVPPSGAAASGGTNNNRGIYIIGNGAGSCSGTCNQWALDDESTLQVAFKGPITESATFTVSGASSVLSGAISAASWTTTGIRIYESASILTDTSATGTVTAEYTNTFGGNTIAASNSGVTFTNYYESYAKLPVAGTNVTLTNAWGFGADSIRDNGPFEISSGTFIMAGNITNPLGTTGQLVQGTAATINDATTGAGTVTTAYQNLWPAYTLTTTTNAVTVTTDYGNYFTAPVAGSHVTLTNTYALGADSFKVNGLFQVSGGNVGINVSSNHTFQVNTGTSSGAISIGGTSATTTVGGPLDLTDIANSAGNEILCYDTTGGPVTYENAVAGCVPSAARFKIGIEDISTDIHADLALLRPSDWTYKDTAKFGDNLYVGLIADDVARMDPRCAVYDADGALENYSDRCLMAHVIAGMQQQQAQIESLKHEMRHGR